MNISGLFSGSRISVVICIFVLTCCPMAWGAPASVSPVQVVQRYCRLDMAGARLSSRNPDSDAIFALVTWPDEPGWDSVTVVGGFRVVGEHGGKGRALVTIQYAVLGELSGVVLGSVSSHKENVTFNLRLSKGKWLISGPVIRPHVSARAAVSSLRSLLREENDPRRIHKIRASIADLQRLSGK